MFKKDKENAYFRKNKKYRIIESFENNIYESYTFERSEQLIYKGSAFIPYCKISHKMRIPINTNKYVKSLYSNELNNKLRINPV